MKSANAKNIRASFASQNEIKFDLYVVQVLSFSWKQNETLIKHFVIYTFKYLEILCVLFHDFHEQGSKKMYCVWIKKYFHKLGDVVKHEGF